MKCHEARRKLDVFHDGELSVPENLQVLEHLNLCASCGEVYEGEKALRAALKEQLGPQRAPAELGDRIRRRLNPAPSPPRWRWSAMAAAVLAGVVTAALLLTPGPGDVGLVAADVVKRHEADHAGYHGVHDGDERCLCRGCCRDAAKAAAEFFGRHGRKDACLHDLSKMGYRLTGVAAFKRRGRLICWTVRKNSEGKVISHGLLPGKVDLPGKDPVVIDDGRAILFHPRGDTGMT